MTVDDDPAKQIFGELQADAAGALENLRDLARGIYPPLLADLGLAAALSAQASKSAVPVAVKAGGIGRFRFAPSRGTTIIGHLPLPSGAH